MAVIGSGIVGTLAALRLATLGHRVDLLERRPELWTGASAANEGKIHLGAIFALGAPATHDVMRRGAHAFTDAFEEAVGAHVAWDDLTSEPFDHLVMPDSLLSLDELRAAYGALNDAYANAAQASERYLGGRLDRIVDPRPSRDPDTGLPRFRTRERAVDPLKLRAIALAAVEASSLITVRAGLEVATVSTTDDDATVTTAEGDETYGAVVNAAWAWQNRFLPTPIARNFRVKAAVWLPADTITRSVTMVQGPYGDIVAHADRGYASWYPTGRLVNEHGMLPTRRAEESLDAIHERGDLVRSQLDALAEIGLLPPGAAGDSVGGFIVGDGARDIDDPASRLHDRSDFGIDVRGRIITPMTFKFTTGPLAARLAADTLGSSR